MMLGLGALGVGVLWLVGLAGMSLIPSRSGALRAGFSYGFGLVWIATAMGAAALLGIPLARWAVLPLVVVPWFTYVIWSRRSSLRVQSTDGPVSPTPPLVDSSTRDPWWWGAAAFLALGWLIVTARAMVVPVRFWDAWATYAFKAKVIYSDQAITHSLFDSVGVPNYPLGIPLWEVWVTWFVGTWDDTAVKWLFPGCLLALWCLVYGALRERWPPRSAMVGTLFVAALPLVFQHGQDGYSDLHLAYFTLGSAVALSRYAVSTRTSDLVLASVFAAGSVWSRADGVMLVVCNIIVLIVLGTRAAGALSRATWVSVLTYAALPAAVWGGWELVKLYAGISSNLGVEDPTMSGLDPTRVIGEEFIKALFLSGNWLIVWPLFLIALLYRIRDACSNADMFLVWPVIGYLGGIAVLASRTELFQHIGSDAVLHRLILHVAPLAALWVAVTYGRWRGVERDVPGYSGLSR